ncbi:unnamed protein product, partial [Phaeothamnion confervicola]
GDVQVRAAGDSFADGGGPQRTDGRDEYLVEASDRRWPGPLRPRLLRHQSVREVSPRWHPSRLRCLPWRYGNSMHSKNDMGFYGASTAGLMRIWIASFRCLGHTAQVELPSDVCTALALAELAAGRSFGCFWITATHLLPFPPRFARQAWGFRSATSSSQTSLSEWFSSSTRRCIHDAACERQESLSIS